MQMQMECRCTELETDLANHGFCVPCPATMIPLNPEWCRALGKMHGPSGNTWTHRWPGIYRGAYSILLPPTLNLAGPLPSACVALQNPGMSLLATIFHCGKWGGGGWWCWKTAGEWRQGEWEMSGAGMREEGQGTGRSPCQETTDGYWASRLFFLLFVGKNASLGGPTGKWHRKGANENESSSSAHR